MWAHKDTVYESESRDDQLQRDLLIEWLCQCSREDAGDNKNDTLR